MVFDQTKNNFFLEKIIKIIANEILFRQVIFGKCDDQNLNLSTPAKIQDTKS